jgi:hypothetical protein
MAAKFRFDLLSVLVHNNNELLELVPKAEPVKIRREPPPRSVKDAYPSLDNDAYWLEQSDARYHHGMTAQRLETREKAIQSVKERIRKRRVISARSPFDGASIGAKLKRDAMRRLQVLSLEMPIHTSGFLNLNQQYWYEPSDRVKPASSLATENKDNYWYEHPRDTANHIGTLVAKKLAKAAAMQRLAEVERLRSLCTYVYQRGQADESVFSGASISRNLRNTAERQMQADVDVDDGVSYWDA